MLFNLILAAPLDIFNQDINAFVIAFKIFHTSALLAYEQMLMPAKSGDKTLASGGLVDTLD